jgi:hypothetical protein
MTEVDSRQPEPRRPFDTIFRGEGSDPAGHPRCVIVFNGSPNCLVSSTADDRRVPVPTVVFSVVLGE